MPERRVGWDVELVRWASDLVGEPFVWGETDCGTLCRRALEVLYAGDVATELLGPPWDSVAGARRAWARLEDLEDALAVFGALPVDGTHLQTGDIVQLEGDDRIGLPRFAVSVGGRLLRCDISAGISAVPIGWVPADVAAWRLP